MLPQNCSKEVCLLVARRRPCATSALMSAVWGKADSLCSARVMLQAESAEWQQLVLRFCIRPLVEQIAPGHHGYPRASDLILG